jgi:hypothetical protein
MNARATINANEIPTIPGTPFQGGFFVSRFRIGENHFGLIVSPRATGQRKTSMWSKTYSNIAGASSFNDGMANTRAMAEAKLPLAQWALDLSIDGHSDWYLPSRDEVELCYRHLKPTTDKNRTWRHGENPSALPFATHPYTEAAPEQTTAEPFRAGGEEAFDADWYWSSTQYSADYAWFQDFGDGDQGLNGKGSKLRARAVRRLLIIQ